MWLEKAPRSAPREGVKVQAGCGSLGYCSLLVGGVLSLPLAGGLLPLAGALLPLAGGLPPLAGGLLPASRVLWDTLAHCGPLMAVVLGSRPDLCPCLQKLTRCLSPLFEKKKGGRRESKGHSTFVI